MIITIKIITVAFTNSSSSGSMNAWIVGGRELHHHRCLNLSSDFRYFYFFRFNFPIFFSFFLHCRLVVVKRLYILFFSFFFSATGLLFYFILAADISLYSAFVIIMNRCHDSIMMILMVMITLSSMFRNLIVFSAFVCMCM